MRQALSENYFGPTVRLSVSSLSAIVPQFVHELALYVYVNALVRKLVDYHLCAYISQKKTFAYLGIYVYNNMI